MSRLKTDAIRNTSASADALTFDTNGNTKIADNEELQIGTGGDLVLKHTGSANHIDHSNGNLWINAVTQHEQGFIHDGSDYQVRCTPDAEVSLYYDNAKKIETIATGVNVTGGIRLGGNNAVNELDDYEEGTFTPILHGYYSSAWSDITLDAGSLTGRYTKIGNTVHITIRIAAIHVASAADDAWAALRGLPFTAINSPPEYSVLNVTYGTVFTNTNYVNYFVNPNTTYAYSNQRNTTNYGNYGGGTSLNAFISGTYTVA